MKRIYTLVLGLALLVSITACGAPTRSPASAETAPATPEPPAQTQAVPEMDDSIAEEPEPVPETDSSTAEEPEPVPETDSSTAEEPEPVPETDSSTAEEPEPAPYEPTEEELAQRQEIENALNLANNPQQTWAYSAGADAWVLDVVPAVVNPELPDQQGVSVCAPGAYVLGIDTDGDGTADVTAENGEQAVSGRLVIDHDAEMVSTNGQIYTADTAPVILTTGAAGYGSQYNSNATTSYAADGYIAISCGNRGKQDSVTDAEGNVLYYTGDAPSCLVDQKAATRFVKFNILLGNLPGSVEHFVSTGGSGGAAHASMFAATSNHPDFYDYQIEAGAVGVYRNGDGSYSTAVTIDAERVDISDGAWGCVAYSAISSLYEGDMAQAFEYYMDTTYTFNTAFQAQLAAYLSTTYMDYINTQSLTIEESKVGFDLDGDGKTDSTVPLTIAYDLEKYPETNGYYGTYLDLYRMEFIENLQWYLDNLCYAEGWTWFDEKGAPMANDAVAAMTADDRAVAFLEGRYARSSTGFGGPGGPPPGGPGGPPPGDMPPDMFGAGIRDGGPGAGTTASAGGGSDSRNYSTFEEMAAAYAADVAELQQGDLYGKNIVALYNPLNYIGAAGTDNPAWSRIVMGAVEGDMAMMASLNFQIAWLNAGVDAEIEWQWDGGHVPSEVLGQSFSLYVDQMYGIHADAVAIEKPAPVAQTENGTQTEMTGKDISAWVDSSDLSKISFTLADVLNYRNSGASKAVPGFDVIDYGQEDYVFGDDAQDARHWNEKLNAIFQDPQCAEVLAPLFNAS